MTYYMEFSQITNDDHARSTGVGACFETDFDTVENFESLRIFSVALSDADYVLDLYDSQDDNVDTLGFSTMRYKQIVCKSTANDIGNQE